MDVVPFLPDDILFMVFGQLSMNERKPLGTSCKRFRNLDFEKGEKNYERVTIIWNFYGFEIIFSAESGSDRRGRRHNTSRRYDTNPVQVTYHDKRILRKASTDDLEVKINKANCDQYDFEQILSLLASLSFRKLTLVFVCGNDRSGSFVQSLLLNGCSDLSEVQVHLSWENMRTTQEIAHIRNTLFNLPKINKLKLKATDSEQMLPCSTYIVNNVFLLHLVSQTNFAVLDKSDCNAEVLTDAWELVRDSDGKCVEFLSPTSEVCRFIAMPNMEFNRHVGSQRLMSFYVTHIHKEVEKNAKIDVGQVENCSYSRIRMKKKANFKI